MYVSPEVKAAIKENSKISLYSDMKWLISKTGSFFYEFGNLITYPPAPQSFATSAFLSSRFEDMSSDQEAAVKLILSKPLAYVWGVPGSGKTQYVLATAINECVRRGERVAVIAPTNLSLEQVLKGLMRSFSQDESRTIVPERDVVRIGNPTAEFLREYPSICENKRVRTDLLNKISKLNAYTNTLHERRYEELKGICDEAVTMSQQLDDSEASAEKIFEKLKPLRDEMMKDQRFKLNAARINTTTIRQLVVPVRDMIYGGDRAEFFEGDNAELSDDQIRARIDDLNGEITMLNASNPKADIHSCKVISMTLAKFIISFGPEQTGARSALDVDRIFVDEAGYCNVIQLLSLFSMGVPIALLGDHMQLPPVCEVDRDEILQRMDIEPEHRNDCFWGMSALHVDSFFEDSVEKLIGAYKNETEPEFRYTSVARLTTTHRFGQNLADALGAQIYNRKIISGNSDEMVIRVIDVNIDQYPVSRAGKVKRENSAESDAVGRFIKEAEPDNYAILTPYRDQVLHLRRNPDIPENRVLTIHKSQGREWDTVIISVCDGRACNNDKPPRFTSTVWNSGSIGKKVINTALSRAKKELIIVCDAEYWTSREGELIGELVRSAKERIVLGKD